MSRILALFAALLVAACSPSDHPSFKATDISGADYGKDFSLTDFNGKPRTLEDFKGKVVTIFFGYTQCPDVCPTNMATMAQVMKLLGPDSDKVQVLFVTVDPERDTPKLLSEYVPAFYPTFLGLYTTPEKTRDVAKSFKVFYQKHGDIAGGNYTVDHSAGTYVYDPKGRLRLFVKHGAKAEDIAHDIKLLLAGN